MTRQAAKWFIAAYKQAKEDHIVELTDGTYEAVGLHFNGNPYQWSRDTLIPHGKDVLYVPDRSFEGIREYLRTTLIEGIVFWKDGEPKCKIKRTDFGFEWPIDFVSQI